MSTKLERVYNAVKQYGVFDLGITFFENTHPKSTLVLEVVKSIGQVYDQIKLNYLLNGLSNGYDTEKKLDELYNYIRNPERAFLVSDCFKKLMLAQSPVVCCILGLMLSDSMRQGAEFDSKDSIVMNGIVSFTDYDLRNFQDIMSKRYDVSTIDGYPRIDSTLFPDDRREELELTLELCIQNRILRRAVGMIEEGNLSINLVQYGDIAERLGIYVARARTQLKYGEN